MPEKIDFFNQVVIAKYSKPSGWRWHTLNAHKMPEDFVQVSGGVPTGVVSRGPRKGSPKWSGSSDTVFIRMAEIYKAQRDYEEQTGNCHVCCGEPSPAGKKPCSFCKGTGKPSSARHGDD